MDLLVVGFCIVLLIILISVFNINAVLSFLCVSIIAGLLLGIPAGKVTGSIQKGLGDSLGGLVFIITIGAMLGKLIAESGASQKIADIMMAAFGKKYIQWALVVTGFIIGIPLFYGVGFVLVVPLIFSVTYKYKLNAVFIGLPMLAALSVTFGFLPPHPAPTALVVQFHANLGLTLIYGLCIAVPAIIIAGPLFATTLKNIKSVPLKTFEPAFDSTYKLPGGFESFFIALLPVIILMITTLVSLTLQKDSTFKSIIDFTGDPIIVMVAALMFATYILGLKKGKSMKQIMIIYADAVKDIGMILLIVGSAGAFKQILIDSGVSGHIAHSLNGIDVNPLLLAWLIAAVIRACVGSATIAGLTTAGIVGPLLINPHINPNLMVLSIGAGSLFFSHVNDSGFWLFKEYFNLSIKDTIRSWSLMETIISLVGLGGVLLLNIFV